MAKFTDPRDRPGKTRGGGGARGDQSGHHDGRSGRLLLCADPSCRSPARSAATWRRIPAACIGLKYGVTSNNVLGLEMVLIFDAVFRARAHRRQASRRSAAMICLVSMTGSEGLLGVVTEVTDGHPAQARNAPGRCWSLRGRRDAGDCVARIIGPVSTGRHEMMDGRRSMRSTIRPCRLSARCRGAADRRARRRAGRGRSICCRASRRSRRNAAP